MSTVLREFCEVTMGQAPAGTSYNFDALGVPLVAGASDLGENTPTPSRWTTSPTQVCREGDIILCIRATIGDRNWADREYCLGRGVAGLRPARSELEPRYLWHWLDTATPRLRAVGRGATFLQVSRRDIEELTFAPPPLKEQRRIAAILDQAEALRAKRRAALAKLDTLTQSIFLEMFGDPVTNPKGWPKAGLGDVSELFAGSTLPTGCEFDTQADGYFLLKVSDMNLRGNETELIRSQLWSPTPGARSCTCPSGSVVIPKRGAAIATNKKRLTTRPAILDPNLMAIWPIPKHLEAAYLYCWFQQMDLASITSGSSVPQLNKQDLRPLEIALPPLALQGEFARRVDAVEKLKAAHRASLAKMDDLFASLQQRAFRGEL